jgi:DNA polymerase-3 subunit epsilon
VDVAYQLGLRRDDVLAVHVGYLRDLARAAWSDQVISPDEQQDIDAVAAMLGLDAGLSKVVVQEARAVVRDAGPASARLVRPGGLTLSPGDKVVLTGAMTRERDDIIAQAAAVGIRVGAGVSKQTAVLVAADPDSLSGKAKKARALGVPVVSEAAFFAVLDCLGAVSFTASQQTPHTAGQDLSYEVI